MRRAYTPNQAVALSWIMQWWRSRSRAGKLVTDYEMALAQFPLVFADIARKACAFDTTCVPGDPAESHALSRAREVWIHIQTMARLTPSDLKQLEEETDDD